LEAAERIEKLKRTVDQRNNQSEGDATKIRALEKSLEEERFNVRAHADVLADENATIANLRDSERKLRDSSEAKTIRIMALQNRLIDLIDNHDEPVNPDEPLVDRVNRHAMNWEAARKAL
jgi:hypothetical protein